jgi:hypothetical protein
MPTLDEPQGASEERFLQLRTLYPLQLQTTQKCVVRVYLFLSGTITAITGRFIWGFVK